MSTEIYMCIYVHVHKCNRRYICMDANVHTYMHMNMDINALNIHTYKPRKKGFVHDYIHTYTYKYADINICKQTSQSVQTLAHTNACMCTRIYVREQKKMHTCIYIYICVYTFNREMQIYRTCARYGNICMYTHLQIFIYIYIYI